MKKKNKDRNLPDVRHLLENPLLPPLETVVTKDEMCRIIDDNCGILSLIVVKTGYTYTLIYKCLDHYGLRDYAIDAKRNIVSKAESVLINNLDSENEAIRQKAAETILKSRFAFEQGWGYPSATSCQQINISHKDDNDDKMIQIKTIFGIPTNNDN